MNFINHIRDLYASNNANDNEGGDSESDGDQRELLRLLAFSNGGVAIAPLPRRATLVRLDDGDDSKRQAATYRNHDRHHQMIRSLERRNVRSSNQTKNHLWLADRLADDQS